MTITHFVLIVLAAAVALWAAAGPLGIQQRLVLMVIAGGLVFAAAKKKATPKE